jgi:hypothetical protein
MRVLLEMEMLGYPGTYPLFVGVQILCPFGNAWVSRYLPLPRGSVCKTRGQDGSLLLSCKTLSFSTSCRFIPVLWVSIYFDHIP